MASSQKRTPRSRPCSCSLIGIWSRRVSIVSIFWLTSLSMGSQIWGVLASLSRSMRMSAGITDEASSVVVSKPASSFVTTLVCSSSSSCIMITSFIAGKQMYMNRRYRVWRSFKMRSCSTDRWYIGIGLNMTTASWHGPSGTGLGATVQLLQAPLHPQDTPIRCSLRTTSFLRTRSSLCEIRKDRPYTFIQHIYSRDRPAAQRPTSFCCYKGGDVLFLWKRAVLYVLSGACCARKRPFIAFVASYSRSPSFRHPYGICRVNTPSGSRFRGYCQRAVWEGDANHNPPQCQRYPAGVVQCCPTACHLLSVHLSFLL
ncbi:uncharacterized protein CIMG_11662 [Coccidioides immitis RS]|uniref:Uncharacterized protein n=1 Tax=Coccidioides immitis (strain RS) TaxID=246410 RepID=A0A0D8JW40_COCIM|nr:uncharacterized protein CIMG_11662 [Coccidioides immitis RS]KJF60503.1 hypothetical protein CIMG_11662 [Coccidioides immitis RS]